MTEISTGPGRLGGRSAAITAAGREIGRASAALIRGIAHEHGRDGIRANTISQGSMETPGLVAALDKLPSGAAGFAAPVPLGSPGRAQDILDAVVFLAPDESR